ncbi:MAG: aminoacyl-histidine dipeptidase [Chitinispirillia bacterium]|nr:aminoacyl-histidine dipeptidase [Chitinispirillia bacterium]
MAAGVSDGIVKGVHGRALYYFKDKICAIPHGSGKEEGITSWLVEFAKGLGLECKRGDGVVNGKRTYNVVIKKPGTSGYEGADAVVLQAHIDMVCQKAEGSAHDFDKDPLHVVISEDGRYISARDTTLGADNGAGAALMLAVLESGDISHPPIEALFTTDEEDGMSGAIALPSDGFISGRRLINIDTEDEGTLCCGCAGGVNANFRLPIACEPVPAGSSLVRIDISGLKGGHSGIEIHQGRANAHKLMARVLHAVKDAYPMMRLVKFTGGDKRNVITRQAGVVIAVDSAGTDAVTALIDGQKKIFAHEYCGIESGISLKAEIVRDASITQVLSISSSDKLLAMLLALPNGVQAMHGKVAGLVETSCNIGIVRQEADHIFICSLIRSCIRTKKLYTLERMRLLAALAGAEFSFDSDYPDWEPNPQSDLLARFRRAYESAFPGAGDDGLPVVESVHAGLECGYFSEKFPGMDLISFGPTIKGAHTIEERLDIVSMERVVRLLLTVLGQMAGD